MASKTVTITPAAAAAAGCTATCESYRHLQDSRRDVYYFQIVGVPVAGWQVKYIKWKIAGTGAGSYTYSQGDKVPVTPSIYDPYAGDLIDGWSDYTTPRSEWTLYDVEVEFETAAPTHTDLLVNSSTVESPAKLVYYPTSNLLVADF